MRFTYGLLGALASSAMGQRFTNTSTSAVTTTSEAPTSTTSGPVGPPQPVDISSAVLGPFASFVNLPGGGRAVQLSAPANGVASFSISGDMPENITLNDLINVLFSLLVSALENRKRATTDCSLDVTLNGENVFSEQAQSTGGEFFDRVTSAARATGNQQDGAQANVEFVQTCGDNPVNFQITDVKIAPNTGSDTGPGDGGSGPITTGTDGEPITTGTDLPETIPTDSEGNPITATETLPTDSEGNPITATETLSTDSEGNPITGTQTFSTDSAGNPITTGTDVSDTVSEPTASETSVAGFPPTVGDFSLFGCVGSSAGFPSFELAQSSGSMDLELCSSLCGDSAYFGVYDTDCYCGDVVDSDDTSRTDLDSCDIECPGDDSEFCGGDAPISRRSRIHARQAIPNTILLTVYVQLGGADSTVTNVIDATVTDQSTITTTFVTTIAGATTTEVQTVTAIYECHNGQCYPNTGEYCYDGKCYSNGNQGGHVIYIFVPYPGEQCDGQTVYISESCNCKGGSQYVPKYCSGGSCNGLTVYKPQQTSHYSSSEVCYTPANCDVCEHGDVVYKPWEDSWGTPSKPVYGDHGVPSCSNSGCPAHQEESNYSSQEESNYSSHEEESYSSHSESDSSSHSDESYSNHKESDYTSHGDESASGNHESSSSNNQGSHYGSDSGSKGASGNSGADCGDDCAEAGHGGSSSDSGSKGEAAPGGSSSDSGSKGSDAAPGGSNSDSGSKGAEGGEAAPGGSSSDSGSKGAEGGEAAPGGSSSDSGSKGAEGGEAAPGGSSSDSGSKGVSGHPDSDVPVTVSSAGKQAVSAVALLAAVVAALF
ncbi:hypothetical protein NW762_003045 [Fusarium torreyae]|uniref:WSC domain-containing protein n=1 Tax=Fusarium torreyae TaxID=1237075 RepID=A0A9W8SBR9_9HYPO|nr:hypothetical protein NW762_003045 [Fusarium torreyae]